MRALLVFLLAVMLFGFGCVSVNVSYGGSVVKCNIDRPSENLREEIYFYEDEGKTYYFANAVKEENGQRAELNSVIVRDGEEEITYINAGFFKDLGIDTKDCDWIEVSREKGMETSLIDKYKVEENEGKEMSIEGSSIVCSSTEKSRYDFSFNGKICDESNLG